VFEEMHCKEMDVHYRVARFTILKKPELSASNIGLFQKGLIK
jgi:hypothetical protein